MELPVIIHGLLTFSSACIRCQVGRCLSSYLLCIFSLYIAISIIGLTNLTLPTIEKRFSLSDKQIGGIAAANDVSALLVVLFVSFYGDYGNKIRWIGGGGILLGMFTFHIVKTAFLIQH